MCLYSRDKGSGHCPGKPLRSDDIERFHIPPLGGAAAHATRGKAATAGEEQQLYDHVTKRTLNINNFRATTGKKKQVDFTSCRFGNK